MCLEVEGYREGKTKVFDLCGELKEGAVYSDGGIDTKFISGYICRCLVSSLSIWRCLSLGGFLLPSRLQTASRPILRRPSCSSLSQ